MSELGQTEAESAARVRIGILGAARIAPAALVKPASLIPDVTVTAIAARDPQRARRFSAKHAIPLVYDSYESLVESPDIDAVYIPLPNALHASWILKAIAAGKHVLCEKPFTANAEQAREVADVAAKSGLVVMEAFHYRYHPLAARMLEVCGSGELGPLRSIEVANCFPLPAFGNIRYSYPLAGGALMDAGCYALHCLKLLGGATPEVIDARAKHRGPDIDRAMTAHLRFPDGVAGRITTSMWSSKLLDISARVIGEHGEMRVTNFVAPQLHNSLKVKTASGTRRERVRGEASYTYQLRAFTQAVLSGGPVLTPPGDAVVTMSLIDDVYRAAGMRPRGQ